MSDTMSTQNISKGSEWRKWDLHVHTPASIKNSYGADWNRYIAELESLPPEFAVLGINDYLFIFFCEFIWSRKYYAFIFRVKLHIHELV